MRRSVIFVRSMGVARCCLPSGRKITIPIVPGLLKHPSTAELASMLKDPITAQKYTREALRRAPWPVLQEFPRAWLKACLNDARLPKNRARAVKYMLS